MKEVNLNIIKCEVGGEILCFAFDLLAYRTYKECTPPLFDIERKFEDIEERTAYENSIGEQIGLCILKATLFSGMDVELSEDEVFELRTALDENDYVKIIEKFSISFYGINPNKNKKKGEKLSFSERMTKRTK